jgi:hypothetical protein
VLLSIILPVIGLIAGIVYIVKGGAKRQVGLMCVGLSLTMMLVYGIVLATGS